MIVRRVEALGLPRYRGRRAPLDRHQARHQHPAHRGEEGRRHLRSSPDPKLFKRLEEKALAKAVDEIEKAAASAAAREDFEAAMAAMAKLRGPVDEFFDHVTVNATELDLRANRLRLLNRIRATTLTVADFSKIEG
jgi:glycyl-tRNA synthetase beta chain